ncbi:hypothetical protein CFC21_005862 [Triticum aestivum]|uniref:Uncharacterized protein n=2 Tax=Triticum aestivum TaxID=4565 RepID=A0A9R1DAH2_WHEAT|nr:hypothetical protein CFC21_005862 [Triticum aestivum]
MPVQHLDPLVLGAAAGQVVAPVGDPARELGDRAPLVRRHRLVGALVQQHPDHRVLPGLHRQDARVEALGGVAHEVGADADGGGGGDVGEDVGGEQEVDGAVVGVEGRVEARPQGVVHDGGEAVGAEVDGRAREPAVGLRDGPDVAHLLVPELGGDLGGAEVEAGLARADGGRATRREVAVEVVDAAAQRGVEEPLRLHELGVEQELQLLHVARVHRDGAPPREARPAPRVVRLRDCDGRSERDDLQAGGQQLQQECAVRASHGQGGRSACRAVLVRARVLGSALLCSCLFVYLWCGLGVW